MDKLIQLFGEKNAQLLIENLHIKPTTTKSSESTNEVLFCILYDDELVASHRTQVNSIAHTKEQLKSIKKAINSETKPNINRSLVDIIILLGTQVYGDRVTETKIKTFESDFWFKRLRDLIQNDKAKSRKQFMLLATYWYVLIEIEGFTESEVVDVLSQDKTTMHDIAEKRDIKKLSDFIERVHYIASTKQIEYFIKIIKNSSASETVKDELIHTLLHSEILDTWEAE